MTDLTPYIAEIALPVALRRTFDYVLPDGDKHWVGKRVRVSFARRSLTGVVLTVKRESAFALEKLKAIDACLDETPTLSHDTLKLAKWVSTYYQQPIGQIIQLSLPSALRGEKTWPEQQFKLDQSVIPSERAKQQVACFEWLQTAKTDTFSQSDLQSSPFSSAITRALKNAGTLKPCRTFSVNDKAPLDKSALLQSSPLTLNPDQQMVVDTTSEDQAFQVTLLHGVTGSGKTEVYLQLAANYLARGLQILVLVPEIGLTPQLVSRFKARFSVEIACLHSGMADGARLQAFESVKKNHAKILIGTRSALFSDLPHLGLIIIDEEHDSSFKQQDNARYSARDSALMLAKMRDVPILLGSATPSLEILHHAKQGHYRYLRLDKRANDALPPLVQITDCKKTPMRAGIAKPIVDELAKHLQAGNQVLVFLNRRGYAPVFMCHDCGHVLKCAGCDHTYTVHQSPPSVQCHICHHKKPLPATCPDCGSDHLLPIGYGTEQLETALQRLFPGFGVGRVDRDSVKNARDFEALIEAVHAGTYQILIGTQMLAKGHDFPNVTCVAMVDVDAALFSNDFRITERLAQLITQVAGRAGRGDKPGQVLLQTHHPDHPLFLALESGQFDGYMTEILEERSLAHLPPFSVLTMIRAESVDETRAMTFLNQIRGLPICADETLVAHQVSLMGPILPTRPKQAGQYRAQLMLQAPNRKLMQVFLHEIVPQIEMLKTGGKLRWSIDVDPLDMF